jgi:hypothetical protein
MPTSRRPRRSEAFLAAGAEDVELPTSLAPVLFCVIVYGVNDEALGFGQLAAV